MHKRERPRSEASAVADGPRRDHPTAPRSNAKVPPEAAGDELPKRMKPLLVVMQERAVILAGLRNALKHEAAKRQVPPAGSPRRAADGEPVRLCGVSPRLVERLLTAGKFLPGRELQLEAITSGAYAAISAAYAMEATKPAEIFVATMYMGLAMVHLIVPHLRKGDRPARAEFD